MAARQAGGKMAANHADGEKGRESRRRHNGRDSHNGYDAHNARDSHNGRDSRMMSGNIDVSIDMLKQLLSGLLQLVEFLKYGRPDSYCLQIRVQCHQYKSQGN